MRLSKHGSHKIFQYPYIDTKQNESSLNREKCKGNAHANREDKILENDVFVCVLEPCNAN